MNETSNPSSSAGRWLLAPLVVGVVALGVWITGGVLTDDATLAMALTGLWLAVAAVIALIISWRRRDLAAPVLIPYALTTALLGGFLLYTSNVDKVVDEDVIVAPSPDAEDDTSGGRGDGKESGGGGSTANEPMLLARGDFESQAHPTSGVASIVSADGKKFLTLTDFETDPGPDLRIYLAPGKGDGVENAEDLGALKGNKGDQQYEIPGSIDLTKPLDHRVVIWCRAFSVAFGTATLAA